MEKQFNSDLEPRKPEEILTSKVGQSLSPGTPSLNLVWKEEGLSCWFVDIGDGQLTFHISNTIEPTPSRLKHLQDVWTKIVVILKLRGMKTIDTWVEYENQEQRRFAEFFGFRETGFLREIDLSTGEHFLLEEMQYTIPKE